MYSVTFTLSDGNGGTDSETITITVNNVNRPPVLNPVGDKVMDEGTVLSLVLTGSDPDADSLAFSASGFPSFCVWNGVNTLTCSPGYSDAGVYSPIMFSVSDGLLASDDESITLTVNNVNRPPVLDPIGDKTMNEGDVLTIVTTGSDPDGDSLTFSASGYPAFCSWNGVNTLTCTPSYADAGVYSGVLFRVSDGSLSDSETTTITVNNVDVPRDDCTSTLGFWQTHPWPPVPAGAEYSWFNLAILSSPNKKGDAWLILAQQYIAARLNYYNGASVPPAIQTAMTQAKALLSPTKYTINKRSPLRTQAISLANTLDNYNKGLAGVPSCG